MRYKQLDLNLLIALDTLLSKKSVTKAASKLHLSQSAMSGALSRLRESLDDQLLIQVGRNFELTPRAKMLQKPVRDIIMRIDKTLMTTPSFSPKESVRHFVISTSDYVITIFLLDILKKINSSTSNITFEFRHPSAESHTELEAGDIDFIIGPPSNSLIKHSTLKLFQDSYSVIAWKNNAILSDTINLIEFSGLEQVGFRGCDNSLHMFDHYFLIEEKDIRRIKYSVHNFDQVPQLIIGTDLISVMPTLLAQKYTRDLPLKLFPMPLNLPALTEVLQWNVYQDNDPGSQWFRELLQIASGFSPFNTASSPSEISVVSSF